MGQNYNLNSGFGLNVSSKSTANASLNGSFTQNIDLFNLTGTNNSRKEDVFNGNVQEEINMYTRQAMIVGMNLKASDGNIRRFDVNI